MVPASRRRPGFLLRDLTVLAAVSMLSFTLLLPAAQQAKQQAAKLQCDNNLKQIILAAHKCHDVHSKLPPLVGQFPGENAHGTLFYHLLPYLEQDKLYRSGEGEKDQFSVWNNGVYGKVVKAYLCPADASGGVDQRYEGWLALGSYAANFQVFGDPIGNTMEGSCRFASITDGMSNTIMCAERYLMCNGEPNAWGYAGASTWAPAFAYLSAGKFQDLPAQKDCDATVPQAVHAGAMQVGMFDGSVHNVSLNVSPQTWWRAVIPDDGLPVGNDW